MWVVFTGETISEGGFKPGKVSAASLLDVATAKDSSGTPYYKYEILTRTGMSSTGLALYTHTHAHTRARMHACARTLTLMCMSSHSHTHAAGRAHTHTHTHT